MNKDDYVSKAQSYLATLCGVKPNRRTSSPGNRAATEFFARAVRQWNYTVDTTPFPCLDYVHGEPALRCQDELFDTRLSPFSLERRLLLPIWLYPAVPMSGSAC